jgi:hypothetical protein
MEWKKYAIIFGIACLAIWASKNTPLSRFV